MLRLLATPSHAHDVTLPLTVALPEHVETGRVWRSLQTAIFASGPGHCRLLALVGNFGKTAPVLRIQWNALALLCDY
jgi:hypothetical protein